jgi:hypothetical protein
MGIFHQHSALKNQQSSWRGTTVLKRTFATIILLMLCGLVVHVQSPTAAADRETRTTNLAAYAELLRSDVRAEKVAILTEVMGFTEAEDKAFWPIYREYDAEMSKLGDERVALIADFTGHYEQMTDAAADQIATKALDLEARRQAVKAKYYDRVKKATSPRTALRYLQVEHQLQQIIDLQISAALPIAK